MTLLLEYSAFGASLVSAWLYGKSGVKGPVAGLFTACLFIVFGLHTEIYAACVANLIFCGVHLRNLRVAIMNDENRKTTQIIAAATTLMDTVHGSAKDAGWWTDLETGEPVKRNVAELLMLIVTEISEGFEGFRKGLNDDHLPHRSALEVELADTVIRIFDMAGGLELDLPGAMAEKLAYNQTRPDHKIENRRKAGGKKF